MRLQKLWISAIAASAFAMGVGHAATDTDAAVQTALSIGRSVGAAAACPAIAKPRLKTVADKFNEALGKFTTNAQEAGTIRDGYDQGVTFGQRDVSNRQVDCATADRELGVWEKNNFALSDSIPPATRTAAAAAPAPAAPVATPAPVAAPAPAAAPSPAAAPALNVQGVTDTEVLMGMVSVFSGPARTYGAQSKIGVQTAFNMINDAGGIHGRKFRLLTLDDGYDAAKAQEAVKQLYERDKVFGFIGNFGTPQVGATLPYILQRRVLMYAPFVAAQLVRRDPPDRYVFVYRPAVAAETAAAVNYLLNVRRLKPEQIASLSQADGYGDYGYEGVQKAFRAARAEAPPLKLTYNNSSVVDVEEAVAKLVQYQKEHPNAPIKAIVMAPTMRSAAKFIEKTVDAVPGLIYTAPSGVGASSLADELMLLGPKYANGLVVTQAVPDPAGYSSGVLEYRTALKKYFPDEAPNTISFETYLETLILMEGFRRAGPQFDTEKLVDALESIKGFDLSIGAPAGFSRSDHQAIHKVWGTMLDSKGVYQPIEME